MIKLNIAAELDRCLSIVREVEVDANLQRDSNLRSAVLGAAFRAKIL